MYIRYLLKFFIVLFLVSCASSPTGIPQMHIFPESMVSEMGITAFRDISKEKKETNDKSVIKYVNCVANRILENVDSGKSWEIKVFEDEQANAFALPGGKIGVFTGILEIAENQHQLAAIIGHEVGHVLAKHGSARLSTNVMTQAGLALTSAALTRKNSNSSKYMPYLGLGVMVGVTLPYGRAEENEADYLGLELMAKSGFNPNESVTLWKRMQASNPSRIPQFLSTHPSPQTRIKKLSEKVPAFYSLYANSPEKKLNCR